jgi:hypothetical protein
MLTAQNRANLEKLGRYLAKLDTKYQREHFRMAYFMKHEYIEIDDPTEAQRIMAECFCGTSACAVGHAPIVLKEETKAIDWRPFYKDDIIDRMDRWLYYTVTLFGDDFRGGVDGSWLFDFMFGGNWGSDWYDDNRRYNATSWSAADRIAYLFEIGQDDLEDELMTVLDDFEIPFIGAATRMRWISKGLHTYHMTAARKRLTEVQVEYA